MLAVLAIAVPKELQQSCFFIDDALVEKPPRDDDKSEGADGIAQQHLHADAPEEPASIGRMSHKSALKQKISADKEVGGKGEGKLTGTARE